MNYAGVPIGLFLSTVGGGAEATFSAQLCFDLRLSRIRWSVPVAGLVLVNVWVGPVPLTSRMPDGAALSLAGEGCWRFAPVLARAGWRLKVEVTNVWGAPIRPHVIAFWGLAP